MIPTNVNQGNNSYLLLFQLNYGFHIEKIMKADILVIKILKQ